MSTVRVFAGNLPFSVTEEQLKTMFSECGTVVSATIITRGTRSLGYGFVEMENQEAADKAVSAMNKKEVDGRTINVEISRPRSDVPKARRGRGAKKPDVERVASKTTVFVANLPFSVDDAALKAAFADVKAVNALVAVRPAGRSKGFGFVLFANEADQQAAIAAKNDTEIEDRKIAVTRSEEHTSELQSLE